MATKTSIKPLVMSQLRTRRNAVNASGKSSFSAPILAMEKRKRNLDAYSRRRRWRDVSLPGTHNVMRRLIRLDCIGFMRLVGMVSFKYLSTGLIDGLISYYY